MTSHMFIKWKNSSSTTETRSKTETELTSFIQLIIQFIILVWRLWHLYSHLSRRINIPLKVHSEPHVIAVTRKLPEYAVTLHMCRNTNLYNTDTQQL